MLKKLSSVKEFKNLKCSHMNLFVQNWQPAKNCLCLGIHRPPTPENLVSFVEELTDSLRKGSEFYENVIILGDFNIDVKVAGRELDKRDEFCDLFNLTNLIRNETCFTRDHKSTIDLILTNKPKSFQNACITETGLSDFHKLILTFFQNSLVWSQK